MAIQKTPPLGWPHTEAQKYAVGETRDIMKRGAELGQSQPKPPKPGKKKSGCGCAGGLVTILIILVIIGVAAAILVPQFAATSSAEDAFADENPGWEIESSDEPDGTGGPVRLVTWDYNRSIGRLVMMDPLGSDMGWSERPLITGNVPAWEAEELLDAFSDSYSGLSWSYIMEAELLGGAGDGSTETWRVYYRVWPMDSNDEWTDVLTTTATRLPDLGTWSVAGPEGIDAPLDATEESTGAE